MCICIYNFLFYAFIIDPSCVCAPQIVRPVQCLRDHFFSNQSVTCPLNKVFSVTPAHCYFYFNPHLCRKVTECRRACCTAHRFKHTLQTGAVIKGSICVCESARYAHSDCEGLYLLNVPAWWLIVKSSRRAHTQHTLLRRSDCALCCAT